jgi:sulfonate transport system substrate-binding protein
MFIRLINWLLRLSKQVFSFRLFTASSLSSIAVLFSIGLGLSLIISACTSTAPTADVSSSPAQAPSPPPQTSQVSVLKLAHQKGMANLEFLKAQGNLEKRLKEQGIALEWAEFPSTAPLLEAMGVGTVVFGGGGATGSVFAQAGDKPFVRVAKEIASSPKGQPILVLDSSPIKTLADLKGKKVGFAKGASSQYLIVRALQDVGLTFEDIEPVYLSPQDARPAFERGDFDAWVIWDPYTAEAEKNLKVRRIADAGTIFKDKVSVESPAFYYAAPSFVKEQPELLNTILEEVNNVATWARNNPKDAAKLLAERYNLPLDIMETVQSRQGDRRIEPLNEEVLTALQNMADTFTELKVIPKKINVKTSSYNWFSPKTWN